MLRSIKYLTALSNRTTPFYYPPKNFFSSAAQRACHYDVLGVNPNATLEDIKRAYYDKARIYHPDTNKDNNSEETFKILTKAYEVLRDPVSRQIYDLDRNKVTLNQNFGTTYQQHYESSMYAKERNDQWCEATPEETNEISFMKFVRKKFERILFQVCLALGVLLAYDIWKKERNNKKNKPKTKKVVDNEAQKVAVGSLVFESPLVFVRDKPVDPAKLQEEMKRKGFRIEYEDAKPRTVGQNRNYHKGRNETSKVMSLDEYINGRKEKA